MMFKRIYAVLLASAMVGMWIPFQGHAESVVTLTELDTVPNADLQPIPPTLMGDVWNFRVKRRGNVIIQVNTRDDNGDFTSNLDPIAFLFDNSGANLLGAADDNLICNRDQVCDFACPQIGPVFLEEGKYKVVVRDFNRATATGVQCNGGAYGISVTGRVRNLKLVEDDKNVIFDPVTEKEAISAMMAETTSDVKMESLQEQETKLDEMETSEMPADEEPEAEETPEDQ